MAAMAAVIAMATMPVALAQSDDESVMPDDAAPYGAANPAPGLEALVACEPRGTLIAFAASPEPYRIALRATGAGDYDTSFSLRVLRVSHWPARDGGGDHAQVALVDHSNGIATVTANRSTAGERLVEVTASGAHGESSAVHLLRILPAGQPGSISARDSRAEGDEYNSEPELEVLLGGVPVRGHVDLAESPGAACVELRAPDAEGDEVAFSLEVVETAPLDPLADAGAPPVLVDHGDGTAMVMVDKSAVGERLVEIVASDVHGEEWGEYTLRILSVDADSRPRPHAGGLPHATEGRSVAGAPLPPRLVAQARLPMCADTPHTADMWGVDHHNIYDGSRINLKGHPTMSGVPPIEGASNMDARIYYPNKTRVPADSGEKRWWGCYTSASFGTQVPQWILLCDVPGDDRVHYYRRHVGSSDQNSSSQIVNPYTGNTADFSHSPPRTFTAAPGPQWSSILQDDPDFGKFDPYAPIRPDAYVPLTELIVMVGEGFGSIFSSVHGTYSHVPELLPFSDKLVIRATAFHADDVTFNVEPTTIFLGVPDGTPMALVNGTMVSLMTELTEDSLHTKIKVPVKVSDIAKNSGIFIKGINDDERTNGGVVKELHDITLVAEIPVFVHNKYDYEPVAPEFTIEPWGCWPLLNGTAWIP